MARPIIDLSFLSPSNRQGELTVREVLEEALSLLAPRIWTKGWGEVQIVDMDKPNEVILKTCSMGAMALAEMLWNVKQAEDPIDQFTDLDYLDDQMGSPLMQQAALALCRAMQVLHPKKYKEAVEMAFDGVDPSYDPDQWQGDRASSVVICFNDQQGTTQRQINEIFKLAIKNEIQKEETVVPLP